MKSTRLKNLSQPILTLEKKAISLKARHDKEQKRLVQAKKGALENLQSLQFLLPEQHRLQSLLRQYPHHLALQHRIADLKDKNQFHFVQVDTQTWKTHHPVQLNTEDLKNVLSILDSDDHLVIVKSFDLKKVREKTDETVYTLETELIEKSP